MNHSVSWRKRSSRGASKPCLPWRFHVSSTRRGARINACSASRAAAETPGRVPATAHRTTSILPVPRCMQIVIELVASPRLTYRVLPQPETINAGGPKHQRFGERRSRLTRCRTSSQPSPRPSRTPKFHRADSSRIRRTPGTNCEDTVKIGFDFSAQFSLHEHKALFTKRLCCTRFGFVLRFRES